MLLPVLLLLVCVWSPVEPACGPVEEGQPTTLTCEVNTANCSTIDFVLTWRAETTTTDIIRCNSLSCAGGVSRYFSATIDSSGGFNYSSTLTIKNVSKSDPFNMETKWSCLPCGTADPVTVCDPLQFYGSPDVTFTMDSTSTTFNQGESVKVTCSAEASADPSMTLTRERSSEVLANVQTRTLNHTLDSLDCLDTDVYVCSGQNNWGTNSKNISINVRCPQQLRPSFDPPSTINAEVGDTAQIDLEIYGFPEPRSLSLQRTFNSTDFTLSSRHKVKFTARDRPFGVVNVTISDVKKIDYSYYTLTVDNGVGEDLIYNFFLKDANNYSPGITFFKNSTKISFNKGDSVRFICSAQSDPDTSLVLTKDGTGEVLVNVQTTTLTHTLDSLDCLDTGVYVCSGQNSRGTNSKNIGINVRCPQQISPTFDAPTIIDVLVGETPQIDLEVYGYPAPCSMVLQSAINNTYFTSSPRHTLKYTASDVPFGVVTVTIFDIVEAGSTNYTLTVDNGVRDALKYTFYLNTVTQDRHGNEGKETEKNTGEDSPNIAAIIIGVIGVIIVVIFIVIVVLLVRRIQNLQNMEGLYMFPLDTPDQQNNEQTPEIPKPEHHEETGGVRNPGFLLPISLNTSIANVSASPLSRPVRDINVTSPNISIANVSASPLSRPVRDINVTSPNIPIANVSASPLSRPVRDTNVTSPNIHIANVSASPLSRPVRDTNVTSPNIHIANVSASPLSRPVRDTNVTSPNTPIANVSASQPPETNEYEPMYVTASPSEYFSRTSPHNVEPPNIYRRPRTSIVPTRNDVQPGNYTNNYEQCKKSIDSDLGTEMTHVFNKLQKRYLNTFKRKYTK